MKRRLNSVKSQQWTVRLQRFRLSGQSVEQFCLAESVSVPSFYQWKRKLTGSDTSPQRLVWPNGKHSTDARTKPFGRATKQNRKQPTAFSPLTLSPGSFSRSTIRLGGDIEIHLGQDLETVKTIVEAMVSAVNSQRPAVEGARSC